MSSTEQILLTPNKVRWNSGKVPIAVVMITLNEAHNLEEAFKNLEGWAQEVFIVDSFSKDETVNIALNYGVHIVQRKFLEFGDQWNFALHELPINSPWVMKLDPDERLNDELKKNILKKIKEDNCDAMQFNRRLFFMRKPLKIKHKIIRVWKNGCCVFTDVAVNEHPIINGIVANIPGEIEHYDSPNLEHWLEKQNNYTTSEAIISYLDKMYADTPLLFGTNFQRRIWIKKHFEYLPFRFFILFIYLYFFQGACRSGRVGFIWARLRVFVMQMREYKHREIEITGKIPKKRFYGSGEPDSRVSQYKADEKYKIRKNKSNSNDTKLDKTV